MNKRLLSKLILAGAVVFSGQSYAQTTLFSDSFDQKNGLSSNWQISTWVNGHPFGCTFSNQDVSTSKGNLNLSFSGNSGKCAEVRTNRYWQYGSFMVNMKPANIKGTVSSFFLYTGVAGTSTHYEIDIEFLGGSNILHTNYWIAGQQYPLDIDLSKYNINPYKSLRNYAFDWRENSIVWYAASDSGQWIELRRVAASVPAQMQLMMNAWYGDNLDSALYFPGYYSGQAGSVQYGAVSINQ